MKKISITFIAFLCLIVPIIFAQELDDAFLDSLPEGVKEDVLDKVNIKKDQINSTASPRANPDTKIFPISVILIEPSLLTE